MIELGLGVEEAKKESQIELVPDGTYEFMVKESKAGNTGEGRPQIMWTLSIINHPTITNRSTVYFTPLPWISPVGTRDVSGLGFLTALCEGIGQWWEGSTIDESLFYGKTGLMVVGHRKNNTTGQQNNTCKILKRKQ